MDLGDDIKSGQDTPEEIADLLKICSFTRSMLKELNQVRPRFYDTDISQIRKENEKLRSHIAYLEKTLKVRV